MRHLKMEPDIKGKFGMVKETGRENFTIEMGGIMKGIGKITK